MSLLVPDEGEVQLLKDLLGNAALENWTLKLFKSNTTPAETDTAATYAEATFAGYAAKTLTRDTAGGHWAVPSSVVPTGGWNAEAHVAESTYAQQTWTSSDVTAQTIYGAYVVGATSGKLVFIDLFASPRTVNANDVVNYTPRFGGA